VKEYKEAKKKKASDMIKKDRNAGYITQATNNAGSGRRLYLAQYASSKYSKRRPIRASRKPPETTPTRHLQRRAHPYWHMGRA
jgi:hypothetical protein